jgi:hypothetical protein
VIENREHERNHGRHAGNARGHYSIGLNGPFDLVLDAANLCPPDPDQDRGVLPTRIDQRTSPVPRPNWTAAPVPFS